MSSQSQSQSRWAMRRAEKHRRLANAAHCSVVNITTSVDGKVRLWKAVLGHIFGDGSLPAAKLDINDSGATPGVVRMRIGQVFEQLKSTGGA
jgi:malonate decarboxylase delta subunit